MNPSSSFVKQDVVGLLSGAPCFYLLAFAVLLLKAELNSVKREDYVRDGKAVKAEGNEDHPWNQGRG